ncbi:PAS domain S-box protein [Piscinibacter sp. HJYY11]|uniref:PAS domain S-box protein n=1 Tax=Piscinibacter sp. HJYY11 TaxID=2801333 RepID=UPI00191E97F1|nr:PAS domain S-box protein [Piscinibacter sp. HJYY11]MBL0728544.1 PAS domain S-box protein [Piscinibacter sp. HJYY11]
MESTLGIAVSAPPADEVELRRLRALSFLSILDTQPEPVFDTLVQSAATLCGAPMAMLSFLGAQREWVKSQTGLAGLRELPRAASLCERVLQGPGVVEIPDVRQDARSAESGLAQAGLHIGFYAGAPLVLPGGETVGCLCVLDRSPRVLEPAQREALAALARVAVASLLDRARHLADGDRRHHWLYEATPALLHSIDGEGRIIEVSDAWLAHLGYERSEVVGRKSSEFLTPASQARARDEVLPAFFRSGRCDDIEYEFVRKDGRVVDMLLSATLERDDAGQPLRSLAVLQDITERKRLAAELQRTLGDLNAIIDNVPATLGYWDRNGVTRLANREFQASVGLPVRQIVGQRLQDIFDVVDPVAYGVMAPYIARVLEGQRQEFELAMLTTSGLRQLRVTLVPDQSVQAGQVSGFYGLGYDITGRKALELRLSDSEMRYRALFDHLDHGFALHEIIVGSDGRARGYKVLAMNAVYAELLGVSRGEALGRGSTELAPDLDGTREGWIQRFGEVALKGLAYRGEHQLGGGERWLEVVAYQPTAGQFALLVQDISARKAAEALVQRQQERLTHALDEKETLLKEVYHRVKNNLQVVQSLLALQRRSVPDGPARAALDDSVQRVRAIALVHEKLYQSGSLASVSLPEYTRDLLFQIGEVACQRHIAVRADIEVAHAGLDGAIPFGLLVAELVGNAYKHGFRGRKEGEVHVVLRPGPGGAELSVSDDGVGLPEGFEIDGPSRTTSKMGLQLAASLARQLGGELQVHSEHGTRFSAVLKRL